MRLNTTQRENGLVGHWKFDEPTLIHGSKAIDSSGWGNHGTLSTGDGAVNKSVAGKLGKGLSFDGSDDYVEKTGSSSLPASVGSLSLWAKTSNWSVFSMFAVLYNVAKNSSIELYSATSNKLYLWVHNANAVTLNSSNLYLIPNQWAYLVATWDSIKDVYSLYINGNRVGASTTPVNNPLNIVNFRIGLYYDGSAAVNGLIDDVRIYNRALTAGEVKALFENTKLVTTPMIVPKTPIPVIQQHRLNQGAR